MDTLILVEKSKDKLINWAEYMFNKIVDNVSEFHGEDTKYIITPSTFIPLGTLLSP